MQITIRTNTIQTLSIIIPEIHRISSAIGIWTNTIVLLCILVDAMPSANGCIIVPCHSFTASRSHDTTGWLCRYFLL